LRCMLAAGGTGVEPISTVANEMDIPNHLVPSDPPLQLLTPLPQLLVPEFIDPVFTKTSPKRSFSLNRKRAFWLVFAKTGSIISGIGSGAAT
jgi:hypothetical protein